MAMIEQSDDECLEKLEATVYSDVSLEDIFGWMDKKNNQKWSKAVDILVYNSRLYNGLSADRDKVQLSFL